MIYLYLCGVSLDLKYDFISVSQIKSYHLDNTLLNENIEPWTAYLVFNLYQNSFFRFKMIWINVTGCVSEVAASCCTMWRFTR